MSERATVDKKVQSGLERRRLREETVSGLDIRKIFFIVQEPEMSQWVMAVRRQIQH